MTREDARAFLETLILAIEFVPPVIGKRISGSAVVREIEAVGNALAEPPSPRQVDAGQHPERAASTAHAHE